MIKGHCVTNIDDVRCPVTSFVAVPRIGERVAVLYKGHSDTMPVVQVTHYEDVDGQPRIKVELWEKRFVRDN